MAAPPPGAMLQDHVSAEGIVLFVERTSLLSAAPNEAAPHRIADVRFLYEVGENSASAANGDEENNCCQSSVCAALGRLLLEIISMVSSISLGVIHAGESNDIDERSDFVSLADASEPSEKRHAAATPRSGSSSAAAKNLLLELGTPLSLCRMVRDLLDAANEPPPSSAFASVKEVFWDLTKMKTSPDKFLFDRTCPRKALDDTCLLGGADERLLGRGDESGLLTTLKEKISDYMNDDDEGFRQLCCLVPNFAKMFPLLATLTKGRRDEENVISSMDKVGLTKERLCSLFNVLIESICSAGRPVLFAFDDLQQSESFVSEVIAKFALDRIHDGTTGVSGKVRRRGLLIAGAYRSNEVRKDGDLVRGIEFMKESGNSGFGKLGRSK